MSSVSLLTDLIQRALRSDGQEIRSSFHTTGRVVDVFSPRLFDSTRQVLEDATGGVWEYMPCLQVRSGSTRYKQTKT